MCSLSGESTFSRSRTKRVVHKPTYLLTLMNVTYQTFDCYLLQS